jgi:hypothetical protein
MPTNQQCFRAVAEALRTNTSREVFDALTPEALLILGLATIRMDAR